MLNNTSKHAFAEVVINMKAPEKQGVFCLYDKQEELVFIGEADSCLKTALNKIRSNGRNGILMYSAEVSPNPKQRSEELIRSYKERYGKLPRDNQSSN